MVEVFRTTVTLNHHAQVLVEDIQNAFKGYKVNFDLEDCDRILRVECKEGCIQSSELISFLHQSGFDAEVLTDDLKNTSHEQIIYN